MHESAMYHGRLFFETYCPREAAAEFSIVEIGSQNVNGSLREVCPAGLKYTGLDFVEGNGVDLVISDPYKLPLQDASTDILVSSSCFEHSEFFWLVFLEAMRVLKPGGVFYLNVPSNGFFHQWPVDCWRFYPDSGHALVAWGKRNGMEPVLLESFIGRHSAGPVSAGGKWNDFVAVFLKDRNYLGKYPTRMVDGLPEFSNGYSINAEGILRHTARSPDSALMESQIEEIERLSEITNERDGQITNLNQVVGERDGQITNLNQVAGERDGQIAHLNQAVGERDGKIANLGDEAAHIVIEKDQEISAVQKDLDQILRSRSWRVTAPLRTVVFTVGQVSREPLLGRVAERLGIRLNFVLGSTVRQLRASSLFDPDYYLTSNPDVRDASMDPAKHFLLHGWREHRNPSTSFSTSQYLFDNPDVAKARVNPLLHYLRHGQREGRRLGVQTRPSELTLSAAIEQLVSVSHQGVIEAADPSITDEHGNVLDTAAIHYIKDTVFNPAIDAEVEAIRKSGLFDEAFYLSMYADLQPAPLDPIRHYCELGWREGRNPSDDFDSRSYLATYSDIRNAGINPFWHYVVAGASELRHAVPDSAIRYENDIRFGVVDTDIKLLAFYSSPDWALLRSGRPASKGNSQPLLPHEELGFYEPLDLRVLKKQAQMAKRHGLYGFCFHLTNGTNGAASPQPFDLFLAHDDIDFLFCVEAGLYPEDIPESVVDSVLRAVSDKRCIHIEGRPVMVVTMPGEKQHAAHALRQLRCRLADHGVSSLFLIGRWAQAGEDSSGASLEGLCDAVLDLPSSPVPGETGNFLPLDKNGADVVPYGVVASQGVARAQNAQLLSYPIYHSVTLGRDNTAQKPKRPLVYTRFHIRDYRRWLEAAISSVRVAHNEDRRFVFVYAWNDWNEGLFLEPDRQGGFGRVNETTRALLGIASGATMPKVSVIVPNYNHERFLRRRLNSIYGQTYKNIEVILLDDCSSDQSRSLLDQYAAAYPEITRTLYNDENSGSAFRQWAKGIKAATGDLVWIAESDDFCDEHFLEILVRCFDDEAVLLAYAKSVFVDRDEVPMRDEFKIYLSDLECAEKWTAPYVETAHNEVRSALGIKNTIPNASSVLFKQPIDMPLLDDESWLSMVVAGDWVFYLHIIRGGKIAYSTETTNFFRRYEGSAAETTYKKDVFYRELGKASQTVQALYNVPFTVLEQCQRSCKAFYDYHLGRSNEEFSLWYDYESIIQARKSRLPNVMVSTMGFYPGGAEILPIRLANEFKRQGLSVLLLSAGLNPREDGVRRMLRNDVPLIETSDVETVKQIIHDFGVEALNTHQWHIQKYPLQVPNVFDELGAHVASLHGMIEHGDAFGVTEEQLRKADQNVTTWVYTADKNLGPFSDFGLYDKSSARFVKMPNGMQPPKIVPIPRAHMNIPEEAFVLCCVSRAIPDKGWAETILAVDRARALTGRDIRLILVGNGPIYDEYCRASIPHFVYLAGFSENSVGHYAAADMGIMLTKFKSESFPLTIVDCLFAGKPYIASDVGDIRNMLTTADDVAGEVIGLVNWEVPIEKVAQVIAAFATDKQKYLQALALVRDVASRYRIDVVAQQYIRLFERDVRRSKSEARHT
jgi:glycosyltransferase involved in cell wall biosynthesis/SAM-dependent methyltransferase